VVILRPVLMDLLLMALAMVQRVMATLFMMIVLGFLSAATLAMVQAMVRAMSHQLRNIILIVATQAMVQTMVQAMVPADLMLAATLAIQAVVLHNNTTHLHHHHTAVPVTANTHHITCTPLAHTTTHGRALFMATSHPNLRICLMVLVTFQLIMLHIHLILPFAFRTLRLSNGITLQCIVLTLVHNNNNITTTTTTTLVSAHSVVLHPSSLTTNGVTIVAPSCHPLYHLGADNRNTTPLINTTVLSPLVSPHQVNLSIMLLPVPTIWVSLLVLRRSCTHRSNL